MVRETTPRKWRWELNGSWIFESRDDGAILFYPHGWGRAFLVPTEDKRRQIEEFLALWRTRLRSAIRIARWFVIPVLAMALAAVTPPVCHIVSQIPEWSAMFRSALDVGALGFSVIAGSSLVLRFLAETAKADLEKADTRRPFAESLKDYAQQSDWSLLWSEAALGGYFLAKGIWRLRPQRETVMRGASADPHFWDVGVPTAVLGGLIALVALWLIRIKLSADNLDRR